MRCVICALAKNEHRYINDWVKHYVELGFFTIYLYDNDNIESDLILDFIDDNLKDKIHYINIRGRTEHYLQHRVYQEFYKQFNKTFDWCFFCDIDEYLTGIDNVNTFLADEKFNEYNSVRVKWKLFGDDNIIERDTSIPLLDFFKTPIFDNEELSNQGKFFLRGNLDEVRLESCHFAKNKDGKVLKACLPSGAPCKSGVKIKEDYSQETVFLNHYMTKTIAEFVSQKLNRGDAVWSWKNIDISYFWRVNKKTPEKLEWLKERGYTEDVSIDLVVPYVDSTDEQWQKLFNKYNPNKSKEIESVNAKNRFRGQGEFFRFFFRCVETNMPWIGTIHLLVQNKSQVPYWLNTKKVHIVCHDDFIPEEYLPTFNSGTIEMFLHNIPDLSERFIYANDDFYVLKPLYPSDFFIGQKARFNLISDKNYYSNSWKHMCQNNHDVIFGTNKACPFLRLDHEFRPYFKSKYRECFEIYEDQILESISQFREEKNLTCFLFSLYLEKRGLREKSSVVLQYTSSKSGAGQIINKLSNKEVAIGCINDTSATTNIYEDASLVAFFKNRFKSPCIYELKTKAFIQPASLEKIERVVSKMPDRLKDKIRRVLTNKLSY